MKMNLLVIIFIVIYSTTTFALVNNTLTLPDLLQIASENNLGYAELKNDLTVAGTVRQNTSTLLSANPNIDGTIKKSINQDSFSSEFSLSQKLEIGGQQSKSNGIGSYKKRFERDGIWHISCCSWNNFVACKCNSWIFI